MLCAKILDSSPNFPNENQKKRMETTSSKALFQSGATPSTVVARCDAWRLERLEAAQLAEELSSHQVYLRSVIFLRDFSWKPLCLHFQDSEMGLWLQSLVDSLHSVLKTATGASGLPGELGPADFASHSAVGRNMSKSTRCYFRDSEVNLFIKSSKKFGARIGFEGFLISIEGQLNLYYSGLQPQIVQQWKHQLHDVQHVHFDSNQIKESQACTRHKTWMFQFLLPHWFIQTPLIQMNSTARGVDEASREMHSIPKSRGCMLKAYKNIYFAGEEATGSNTYGGKCLSAVILNIGLQDLVATHTQTLWTEVRQSKVDMVDIAKEDLKIRLQALMQQNLEPMLLEQKVEDFLSRNCRAAVGSSRFCFICDVEWVLQQCNRWGISPDLAAAAAYWRCGCSVKSWKSWRNFAFERCHSFLRIPSRLPYSRAWPRRLEVSPKRLEPISWRPSLRPGTLEWPSSQIVERRSCFYTLCLFLP